MMSYLLKVLFICAAFACIHGSTYNRDWYNYPPPPNFNHHSTLSRFDQGLPFPVPFPPGLPIPQRRPSSGNYIASCRNRCRTVGHNENAPCQCNSYCLEHEDCCPDYERFCLSCSGRCFSQFVKGLPCQCNQKCERFENCCDDFEDECGLEEARFFGGSIQNLYPLDDNSCVGRCDKPVDKTKPCQCNKSCVQYGDCCSDYTTVCVQGSCEGRCSQVGTDPTKPCQCNKPCANYGDCCADYSKLCGGSGGVTDPELANISEELLSLDVNNVFSHITYNLQGTTPPGGSDVAPNPLLNVSVEAYKSLTLPVLLALHDNYIPAVGTPEIVTPEEKQEEKNFLDAILSTSIMKRAEEFLVSKGLVPADSFRDMLAQIWFGLYSRDGNILGSSGFEHVFLGELKNGVSGFHNWAFHAREEGNGNLNYNGYIQTLSLGSKGAIITYTMDWLRNKKPLTGMFVGTSPEFEIALLTICWHARPNARCPVTLSGQKLYIQTYDITSGGKKFVASAYADIS